MILRRAKVYVLGPPNRTGGVKPSRNINIGRRRRARGLSVLSDRHTSLYP